MSFTRKVCVMFDTAVHLSSVPFRTTLCRMLGLIGLVAFVEIHYTGYRFGEMPTTLKINGESLSVGTNALANAL